MKYFYPALITIFLFASCSNTSEPESVITEQQFVKIYMKYSFKDEINTFKLKVTKDLIVDGTVTIPFYFTEEEQNKILGKADEIGFFAMPDTFKYVSASGKIPHIVPDAGEQKLRINCGDKDKTIVWTAPQNDDNLLFQKYLELQNFIIDIVSSRPEYKKLPPAKGGYV